MAQILSIVPKAPQKEDRPASKTPGKSCEGNQQRKRLRTGSSDGGGVMEMMTFAELRSCKLVWVADEEVCIAHV